MTEGPIREEAKSSIGGLNEIDLIIQDTSALKRIESEREELKIGLRQTSASESPMHRMK